ncbi:glycosyltransferase [Microbacterium sp. W1N]|uniref:glycosyltransferase n=1 Tax=Microbacterium festucae TaxID=2977531 RepID=UPI0021BF6DB7|nr:glycosyltransferase [Microbacterium festucae]MCT9818777.1 glycosyltransferase [Microbacterium festucae]
MTAVLRVVLDQVVTPVEADLATASRELGRALVAAAPAGCRVEAIVPSGGTVDVTADVPGVADVTRTSFARRELSAAWQLGVPAGTSGGLIHSPTLMAPLVRHDRVHDSDQTVVTVWDLSPWLHADEMPKPAVMWHRGMLKRAAKHADAVVVPTHAMGARLVEIEPRLRDRVRVIAGAAPRGFAVPTDEVGRRRALDLPEGFLLVAGGPGAADGLADAFAAVVASGVDLPVVVLGAPAGTEPAVVELAEAAGLAAARVHVRGDLDDADRAAVLGGAVALLAAGTREAFPWRVVEALTVGVPVIAVSTEVHREVLVDGGVIVPTADGLGAALSDALASAASVERLGVLAADRGRAFSWRGAAEQVWLLHADL